MKLQIWRGNPFQDAEVLEGVRDQLGGPEKMEVMYDRTATRSGTRWSFETALEVAHRLEALDDEEACGGAALPRRAGAGRGQGPSWRR